MPAGGDSDVAQTGVRETVQQRGELPAEPRPQSTGSRAAGSETGGARKPRRAAALGTAAPAPPGATVSARMRPWKRARGRGAGPPAQDPRDSCHPAPRTVTLLSPRTARPTRRRPGRRLGVGGAGSGCPRRQGTAWVCSLGVRAVSGVQKPPRRLLFIKTAIVLQPLVPRVLPNKLRVRSLK